MIQISIRKACKEDYIFYYKLKSEPSSIYWGGFSQAPTVDGLKAFWQKNVENHSTEREILILNEDNSPVGYVQAVFEDSAIGLSMGILECARGKGYGKRIISLAIEYYNNFKKFFCYIREDNFASINSFKANGFQEVKDTYKQFFPLDGKNYTMRRFELHR